MNYRQKYVECKLNFDNATEKEIRKVCFDDKEIEGVKKFYEKLNGKKLLLSLWDYDNCENYHLSGWGNETDGTMMEAMFIFENTFGVSCSQEEFEEAWRAEEYDCGVSIIFPKQYVEELKVICEKQDKE